MRRLDRRGPLPQADRLVPMGHLEESTDACGPSAHAAAACDAITALLFPGLHPGTEAAGRLAQQIATRQPGG